MDLHPIVVHFPIALLMFYSALEIARLPIIKRQSWWFYTKAIMLIGGVVGGFAAMETGEIAAEAFEGTRTYQIVELHEGFATATMAAYGILAAAYALRWTRISHARRRLPGVVQRLFQQLDKLEVIISKPAVLVVAAIAGAVLLTITGAFGGALVYGSEADPIVELVYSLFVRGR